MSHVLQVPCESDTAGMGGEHTTQGGMARGSTPTARGALQDRQALISVSLLSRKVKVFC